MSQEFDIHRELWDYCDNNSKRQIHFYDDHLPSNTPDYTEEQTNEAIFDDPNQMIELMDSLHHDESRKIARKSETKDVQVEPPKLNTPENVYKYMEKQTSS